MNRPMWQKWRFPLLLGLLVVAWFSGLYQIDLRGEEPRRALVAWEMLKSGNYLQPTIQGEPYYNKPPFFNWLIALFYQLFGTNSWVVRLPSLIAYLLCAYLNYRLVSHWVNKKTAVWSSLFFLTAVHYLFFATVLAGELDLLYGTIVFAQGAILFQGYVNQRWSYMFLGSYLLMALGFMTKGLPSVAFQGLTLLVLAFVGNWMLIGESANVKTRKTPLKWLLSWQHLLGILVGGIPILAYFGYYEQQYGNGWLYFFNLIEEASQKSITEGKLLDTLKHIVEFPFQFVLDHLPWVLLLPLGIWKGWHRDLSNNAFIRFCVLFFASNIIIYWLSPGARLRYFYGLIPFFFTPLAYWFVKYRPIKIKWVWVTLFVLACARIAYNFTLLPYQQKTTGTIQLYRQITNDVLAASEGQALYTCCEADTILVDPSIGPITLLQDTIVIPMYTPYQIPLYLQRERDQWLPFLKVPDRPGIYLSTDTLAGTLLHEYSVWDDKQLRVFRVE